MYRPSILVTWSHPSQRHRYVISGTSRRRAATCAQAAASWAEAIAHSKKRLRSAREEEAAWYIGGGVASRSGHRVPRPDPYDALGGHPCPPVGHAAGPLCTPASWHVQPLRDVERHRSCRALRLIAQPSVATRPASSLADDLPEHIDCFPVRPERGSQIGCRKIRGSGSGVRGEERGSRGPEGVDLYHPSTVV